MKKLSIILTSLLICSSCDLHYRSLDQKNFKVDNDKLLDPEKAIIKLKVSALNLDNNEPLPVDTLWRKVEGNNASRGYFFTTYEGSLGGAVGFVARDITNLVNQRAEDPKYFVNQIEPGKYILDQIIVYEKYNIHSTFKANLEKDFKEFSSDNIESFLDLEINKGEEIDLQEIVIKYETSKDCEGKMEGEKVIAQKSYALRKKICLTEILIAKNKNLSLR